MLDVPLLWFKVGLHLVQSKPFVFNVTRFLFTMAFRFLIGSIACDSIIMHLPNGAPIPSTFGTRQNRLVRWSISNGQMANTKIIVSQAKKGSR